MTAYYNEIDPYAAQWLRNLIARGLIAPGEVDERSIELVAGDDLRGFTQCHFFAGIGVWSHALRLAGWPDDRPVWSGSCPCQPFSAAGKGEGYADERHLWPHWYRLIGECRPPAVFGEQVAAAIRTGWLDDVCLSLESIGYAVGAVNFPACSVGAPHIRQRVYFVAHAEHSERGSLSRSGLHERDRYDEGRSQAHGIARACGEIRPVADADGTGQRSSGGRVRDERDERDDAWRRGAAGDMGDAELSEGARQRRLGGEMVSVQEAAGFGLPGPLNGFWSDGSWIACRDGKARPAKPGVFPLAHGTAGRVGKLRAAGNAICAPQAAEFIRAAAEVIA